MSLKINPVAFFVAITIAMLLRPGMVRSAPLHCQAESLASMTSLINELSPALTNSNLKDQGKTITLTGQVTSLATVASLLRSLDTSPHFERAVLVSVVRSKFHTGNMDFRMILESKCSAP